MKTLQLCPVSDWNPKSLPGCESRVATWFIIQAELFRECKGPQSNYAREAGIKHDYPKQARPLLGRSHVLSASSSLSSHLAPATLTYWKVFSYNKRGQLPGMFFAEMSSCHVLLGLILASTQISCLQKFSWLSSCSLSPSYYLIFLHNTYYILT